MTKTEIADVLREMALLLELQGENAFKIRAYQNAARTLDALEEDLATVIAEGRLVKISGIGKAIAEKIATLHETGRLQLHEELRASVPEGLLEMMEIPGLGPKKLKVLYEELGVDSIPALEKACREDRIAGLSGFGARTQEKLLAGIRNREAYSRRHLWWRAREVADRILTGLRELPAVSEAEAAGSLRRGMETVGDLDFLVASANPDPVMDWFVRMVEVREVTAHGATKSSVRLDGGLQADLRVVSADQYCFALHHFTGSKDHNVKMRSRALARGWSLSEWGLTAKGDGGEHGGGDPGAIRSERDLFAFLGLHNIPPELREDMGEIEAAEAGELPRLVGNADLRGVFHNHTTASDGRNTLEEMVAAAEAFGWEYFGIADHSKASFQANGLDEERLMEQVEQIHALNESGRHRIHVFAGSEVDILPDGSLDFADDILAELDYVVVSVHSSFQLDEERMTRRLVRALENPHVHMLGHLTGRLLLEREGYRVNVSKVIDAAIANGKVIEINAHPRRLDMDWRHWKRAAEQGLRCVINPDAHRMDGLEYTRAGVLAARKGWLTAEQVLNTRSIDEIREYLGMKNPC